ncbi:sensor histidine kinase [Oceaniglobus trochenteri]|uniref:sensor histidine kinase n=1 Tax=Oceaniglobus trochenteri TaxID=2763260 RepID=UPI001D001861|nr:HAMP domain-containing sensor histidine kinase [Oceaniglobus trochenteri]
MSDQSIINAFKHIRVALMIVGASGRILHCNRATDRLFGYDVGALQGRPVSDVLAVASAQDLGALIEPPAIDAIVKGMTGRMRSGEPVPLGIQMTVWDDEQHGAQYALVMRDVTAEVRAEKQAKETLRRAQSAIKGARIAVFEYDRTTDTVNVCEIWREILGLGPTEEVNIHEEWRARLHPDDREVALEPMMECIAGKRDQVNCDYRLRKRDGSDWMWIRSDISVTERDRDGNPTRLSGVMSDITQRKNVEKALRRSMDQFKSAFESAAVGMALVGLDGRFLQVNPALCDLLGYPLEDLLKTGFQAVTHPDDLQRDLSQLELLMAGQISTYQLEKRFIRANGAVMWGLLSVGVVKDDDGQADHFVSQVVDVTEQRRLAELKSEFVSTVSHELRTPLTSILGSLSLLSSMDAEPLSDEAQRLLYIAEQNGNRLHTLINDVLDFEKFSAGQMRYELERYRIVGLVEESVMANLASADRFNVRYEVDCPDRTLAGYVDPKRFQQVMANLLSNAAKFARNDSKVDIALRPEKHAIRISVCNDGDGIPQSFQAQLFNPFSQADAASTRSRGGTGLGLSITKQIVEQTGGEIGFDSQEGGRTCFWFTVPTRPPA